jgi:APA family basic amino acid/polyamine antiporter
VPASRRGPRRAAGLLFNLRGAIGFSSFGVLTYYFVANLAALRQRPENRRAPRAVAWPAPPAASSSRPSSVVAGVAVLAVGVGGRARRRTVGDPGGGRRWRHGRST